uniref:hypothetical protein n=1 Tax=Pigmentiphaga litoralis TaxID=516702 RepID=UPI00389B120B
MAYGFVAGAQTKPALAGAAGGGKGEAAAAGAAGAAVEAADTGCGAGGAVGFEAAGAAWTGSRGFGPRPLGSGTCGCVADAAAAGAAAVRIASSLVAGSGTLELTTQGAIVAGGNVGLSNHPSGSWSSAVISLATSSFIRMPPRRMLPQ